MEKRIRAGAFDDVMAKWPEWWAPPLQAAQQVAERLASTVLDGCILLHTVVL